MRLTNINRLIAALVLSAVLSQAGLAQNFSSDARRIALGGAGDNDNIASKLIEEQQPYRSIPIPIGLFQVLRNRQFFNPDDPDFDPVRAIEYAADPLHVTLRRDSATAGNRLVKNLVDAGVSRDLNTYRGFKPASEIKAQGLISPTWGKTIRVSRNAADQTFHGVYVGAGPYLSIGSNLSFDQQLIDLLASSTNVYRPNASFLVGDDTTGQGAVAITGGYRGRLPLPRSGGSGTTREGVYLAANYSYLHGIHYDTADLQLRFDTDSTGLITLQPATTPITVNRTTSKSGKGFAVDLATAVVTEHWDVSVGVDGIGNRINWKELRGRRYVLQSLFNGGDFVTLQATAPAGTRRVSLPIRYSGSGGYHTDRWSAATELGRGLQGFSFNTGAEYRWGPLAFRGGSRYSRHLWHGASGIGFNFTKRFGIDVAAFQNSTNIEETRRTSFAVSLRIDRS